MWASLCCTSFSESTAAWHARTPQPPATLVGAAASSSFSPVNSGWSKPSNRMSSIIDVFLCIQLLKIWNVKEHWSAKPLNEIDLYNTNLQLQYQTYHFTILHPLSHANPPKFGDLRPVDTKPTQMAPVVPRDRKRSARLRAPRMGERKVWPTATVEALEFNSWRPWKNKAFINHLSFGAYCDIWGLTIGFP